MGVCYSAGKVQMPTWLTTFTTEYIISILEAVVQFPVHKGAWVCVLSAVPVPFAVWILMGHSALCRPDSLHQAQHHHTAVIQSSKGSRQGRRAFLVIPKAS